MSYDIDLIDPVTGDVLQAEDKHQMAGGTYAVGGTTDLGLNVTYNYAMQYYRIWPEKGIRTLYGMSAARAIPVLEEAIGKLGDDVDTDYWKPTEGNAKRALFQLLAMAQMRPDGIFRGD